MFTRWKGTLSDLGLQDESGIAREIDNGEARNHVPPGSCSWSAMYLNPVGITGAVWKVFMSRKFKNAIVQP